MIAVRPASLGDAEPVIELCQQLGYTTNFAWIEESLKLQTTRVLLVVTEADLVRGWIEVQEHFGIANGRIALITGIVVDSECRGQGLGKRLVRRAFDWARERGLSTIRVRCQVKRTEAHEFYRACGFTEIKHQAVFESVV